MSTKSNVLQLNRPQAPAPCAPRRAGKRATGSGYIEFDIHGLMSIRVAESAPTASILAEMLEPFISGGLSHHDLTVSGAAPALVDPSHGEHAYRYTEQGLYLNGMQVQMDFHPGWTELSGTRELLTAALPLIDACLVGRDCAMIHAATVSYRGHGIAMPAWGGVGKTSTVAKLLRNERVSLLGDDWAWITGAGDLLGYAKPMFIKPHHAPIYPHLFENKRKPLIPSRFSKPLSQIATVAHPYITKHPKLAGFTRRWSPEHMMVTPRQAFPAATIASSAPLATSVFLERYDGNTVVLEPKDTAWMIARMIGNFHAELPAASRDVITALATTGLIPMERFYASKAAVLERALEGKRSFCLRVPVAMSADVASDQIVQHLGEVFGLVGIE